MLVLKDQSPFAEGYTLISLVGVGGFSEVWKAQSPEGKIEALKIFKVSAEETAKLAKREYELSVQHPRILSSTGFGVWDGYPYLKMPFCKNGTASAYVGKMNQKELLKLILDISSALEHLHNRSDMIIHQDIKPDNFLIDDHHNFLLADFGISKKLKKRLTQRVQSNRQTQHLESIKGSGGRTPLAYSPPETFSRDFDMRKPVKASDIWSLGVAIFELGTGQLPFEQGGALQHTSKGNVEAPQMSPLKFSIEFNELIKWCTSAKTWDRPTAKQVRMIAEDYLRTEKLTVNRPPATKEPKGKPKASIVYPERPKKPVDTKNKWLKPVLSGVTILTLLGLFVFVILPLLPGDMILTEDKHQMWYSDHIGQVQCMKSEIHDLKSSNTITGDFWTNQVENLELTVGGFSQKISNQQKKTIEDKIKTFRTDFEQDGFVFKNCN